MSKNWASWKLDQQVEPESGEATFPTIIKAVCGFRFLEDRERLCHVRWEDFHSGGREIDLDSLGVLRPRRDDVGLNAELNQRLSRSARSLFQGDIGPRAMAWKLHRQSTEREEWCIKRLRAVIPCELLDVELWMFPVGIAYLTITLKLAATSTITCEQFAEVYQELLIRADTRTSIGRRQAIRESQLHVAKADSRPDAECSRGDLDDILDCGQLDKLICKIGERVLSDWRRSAATTDFGDYCLESSSVLRSYACLYLAPQEDEHSESEVNEMLRHLGERMKPSRALGPTDATGLTYKATEACGFIGNQSFFTTSRESTVFVSVSAHLRDPNLWKSKMKGDLANNYFYIYLMTIMQSDALAELRRRASFAYNDESHVEQLEERFVRTIAEGYFSSVSDRSATVPLEKLLRSVYQIDRAYEAAVAVAQIICETSVARYEREENRRATYWQLFAGLTIMPSLYLTFMNVNIKGLTDQGVPMDQTVVGLLVFALVGPMIAVICSPRLRTLIFGWISPAREQRRSNVGIQRIREILRSSSARMRSRSS